MRRFGQEKGNYAERKIVLLLLKFTVPVILSLFLPVREDSSRFIVPRRARDAVFAFVQTAICT